MTKTLTVLGSFHGNAGDHAILASTISEFKKIDPSISFTVLSGRPWLLKGIDARIISVRPSNFSLNMLGIPSFLSIYNSDMVILTASMLFDRKLYNPVFNYLISLSLLVPFAKRLGKPVVGYNIGIGPLYTRVGKSLTRRILNQTDLLILREENSMKLLEDLGVTKPKVLLGADPSVCNDPVKQKVSRKILRNEGLKGGDYIGVNITSYIDSWIRPRGKRMSKESFIEIMKEACNKIVEKYDKKIVLIVTNYIYDQKITQKLANKMKNKDRIFIISNKDYSHREIMGILGEMELVLGMRLHSIILAAAMFTPVIAIIYSPKVRDFMRRINLEDKAIEFDDFTPDTLVSKVHETLVSREIIRTSLSERIPKLKHLVRQSTKLAMKFI